MTSDEFRSLVAANPNWFDGVHPETPDSLAEAERHLGISLPPSLKWLLSEHGYSAACGVPNLAESVDVTARCRLSVGLPGRFVVLDDRGDAGVVLLDASSPAGRVIWVGTHDLVKLAAGEAIVDIDEFDSYADWVAWCLADARDDA